MAPSENLGEKPHERDQLRNITVQPLMKASSIQPLSDKIP